MTSSCGKGYRTIHKCVKSHSFQPQTNADDNCDCPEEYYCATICAAGSPGEYEIGSFGEGPGESYYLGTYISWQHFPRSTSTRSICFDDSSKEILRKSISDDSEGKPRSRKQSSVQPSVESSEKPVTKTIAQLNALHYLEIRHIYQLLSFLISHLVCNEPDDPISFLVDLLDKCIAFRDSFGEPPLVFTHSHIKSLYQAFDPFERGKISVDQFKEALFNLGIDNKINTNDEKLPSSDDGQIDVKYFQVEVERRRVENLSQMLRIPKTWEENREKWNRRMKKISSKKDEINASHISRENSYKEPEEKKCSCSHLDVPRTSDCQYFRRNVSNFVETEQLFLDYCINITKSNPS